jgi:hypothetical protein
VDAVANVQNYRPVRNMHSPKNDHTHYKKVIITQVRGFDSTSITIGKDVMTSSCTGNSHVINKALWKQADDV